MEAAPAPSRLNAALADSRPVAADSHRTTDAGPRAETAALAGATGQGIALVAHDSRKRELVDWARCHRDALLGHRLYATGTTGGLVAEQLDLPIVRFRSGPLGGDQQIGARIAEGEVTVLVFFWDPLSAQPHEPDVRALLRLAVLANIPVACNRATAEYVITSPLLRHAPGHDLPPWRADLLSLAVEPS